MLLILYIKHVVSIKSIIKKHDFFKLSIFLVEFFFYKIILFQIKLLFFFKLKIFK